MAGTTRRLFGSLRKLPSGRYQAAFTGPDGQRHKAPETFATKAQATVWLDRQRPDWTEPEPEADVAALLASILAELREIKVALGLGSDVALMAPHGPLVTLR